MTTSRNCHLHKLQDSAQKALAICTTLFWGIPIIFAMVRIVRFIKIGLSPRFDIISIVYLTTIMAVIAQWLKNRTIKIIANAFLIFISLLLFLGLLIAAAIGGWNAMSISSLLLITFIYPAICITLACLSIVYYSMNRKRD